MLESLFNKVAALKASNLNKKRLQHKCLFTAFFLEQLWWLLLQLLSKTVFFKIEIKSLRKTEAVKELSFYYICRVEACNFSRNELFHS